MDRDGKRAKTVSNGQALRWLLSFRRSAPGGEKSDPAVTTAMSSELICAKFFFFEGCFFLQD